MSKKNLDKEYKLSFTMHNISCEAEANVTKDEEVHKAFNVKIATQILHNIKNAKIDEVSKKVRIDGFRPGKIPTTLIWQKYKNSILQEVFNDAINDSIKSIDDMLEFDLATEPKIELKKADLDEGLEFEVNFEIFPTIELPDLEKISIHKPIFEIQESDIKNKIKELAKDRRNFIATEDSYEAQSGDQVIINFEGKIDGIAFEGGNAKDFALELGSKSFIDNFEEQLVGSKKNDEIVVKVTFPQDYAKKEYASKKAEFFVKINEVKQKQEITNDEELAKFFDLDSADALNEELKKTLEAECHKQARTQMKIELFDQLNDIVKFAIPQTLMDQEFKALWQQMQKEKREDNEGEEELKAECLKISERRLKLGILLAQFAQSFKIQITNKDLEDIIRAQLHSQPPMMAQYLIQYYKNNPKAIESLRGPAIEEKTTDEIFQKVKIVEKPVKATELLELDQDSE